jgi:hypothetical protein
MFGLEIILQQDHAPPKMPHKNKNKDRLGEEAARNDRFDRRSFSRALMLVNDL